MPTAPAMKISALSEPETPPGAALAPKSAHSTAMSFDVEGERKPGTASPTLANRSKTKGRVKPNNDTWVFVIEGMYGGRDKNSFVEKPYKVTITMPDTQVEKGALHQFIKHYAPRMMPKIYKDYQNLFTFEIVNAVCTSSEKEATNIQVMPRDCLATFVIDNELPVELELYADADDLRHAIKECLDPKTTDSFEANQQLRKERIGPRLVDATIALDFIQESINNSLKLNQADDL